MTMKINRKFADYVKRRKKQRKSICIVYGSRRSGKTYQILQYLLLRAYNDKLTIVVAGMTHQQLRNGAFQDALNIIESEPVFQAVYQSTTSPLCIKNRINGSTIIFSSFETPEKSKGLAADIGYINEGNTFSKDIVSSIRVNIREMLFIDFNPVKKFWVNELYEDEEWLKLVYQDNEFLTPAQLEYFEELRRNAEKPNATPMDIYLWEVNGLGNFCGLSGNIFTRGNINICDKLPELHSIMAFLDPSSLRNADYFACSLGGLDKDGNLYILDTYSINNGTPDMIKNKVEEWCKNYDVKRLYIETNGIIGQTFYEDLRKNNKSLPLASWTSRQNKFERIIANYSNITKRTFFLNNGPNMSFLEQVYEFSEKCEHDDNIDSINSLWNAQHFK